MAQAETASITIFKQDGEEYKLILKKKIPQTLNFIQPAKKPKTSNKLLQFIENEIDYQIGKCLLCF